jgi:hypothetical protein
LAVPPPVEPARREPRELKHDLDVPIFENTPQIDFFKSDGEGRGKDRSVAIFSALEQALSKHGAQFSASVRLKLESETKKLNDTKSKRVERSAVSDYSLLTDGLIRWWDIEYEKDDGTFVEVKVSVVIAKIKNVSGQHLTRKTIAVLPFGLDSNLELAGRTVPAQKLGKKMKESVITYLVNSRKFAVVDNSFEEEIARIAGERPSTDPIQRAIQAATKLGADYVVVGIGDGIGVTSRSVGNLEVQIPDGMVSMRIIKVDTRQTVLAHSVQIANISELSLQGAQPENAISDAVGRLFAERALDAIYPFKVVALNGPDEVILNRGGDDIQVGQKFEIANLGEEMKDPATGESLGSAEKFIGLVEVVRVSPKTSHARVLSRSQEIEVGAICRKPHGGGSKAEASASDQLDKLFK